MESKSKTKSEKKPAKKLAKIRTVRLPESDLPHITDLTVHDIEYNLDIPAFAGLKNKDVLRKMLPDKVSQVISFVIHDASPAIANALRRVVLVELEVPALHFEIPSVSTNDKEIILGMLQDRIAQIPVDESISPDVVYTLHAMNNSTAKDYSVVRTRDLKQIAGPTTPAAFAGTFRLVALRPGTYIDVPKITVVRGYGYDHSKFSLTSSFKYQVRDYVSVSILTEKGTIVRSMVLLKELDTAMIQQGLSWPTGLQNPHGLTYYPVLVIPKAEYVNAASAKTKSTMASKFPIVLEGEPIRSYSSAEVSPREYFLEFTVLGNVDPKAMMRTVCDNLIERLTRIKEPDNVNIKRGENSNGGEVVHIFISGEDHTIGNLLKYAIYHLDPSIGLVNSTQPRQQLRVVTINIIHPEPIKIFHDGIDWLVGVFGGLKKQFA